MKREIIPIVWGFNLQTGAPIQIINNSEVHEFGGQFLMKNTDLLIYPVRFAIAKRNVNLVFYLKLEPQMDYIPYFTLEDKWGTEPNAFFDIEKFYYPVVFTKTDGNGATLNFLKMEATRIDPAQASEVGFMVWGWVEERK